MLTLKILQENKEFVIERLAVKNFKAESLINQILELDQKRRSTQNSMDNNQAELNKLAKEIGELFKSGKQNEANVLKEKNAEIKNTVKLQNEELTAIEKELSNILVL